jgi:tRNA (cmo5U34)-methyltransferase
MSEDQNTINGFFCPSKFILKESDENKKKRESGRGKSSLLDDICLFDWLAPHYDRLQPVLDPNRFQVHSVMLDVLNAIKPSPENILDLGCGTGMLTQQIIELLPEAHIYAIDGSMGMLEAARENLDEFLGQITLAKADFRDPWESVINDPIDVVVHYTALHHLPHDALQEVYARLLKVLRPGGWFLHGDFTQERLPEPIQRIAAEINNFQKESAIQDLPNGESLIDEFDIIREANEATGQLFNEPAMPEQQIAWLIETGFEFATRIYHDWRVSLFLARKSKG